ncbi:MAG: hypothetical protein P1P84_18930 [Deferrisomatales bacterium]|nr:hypothetical protein [Deferrisomatales bacterium]
MEEIRSGPHRSREGQSLPADARRIATSGSYQVFVSHAAGSIIIVSSDYHPGPVQLNQRDLAHFSYELQEEMAKRVEAPADPEAEETARS